MNVTASSDKESSRELTWKCADGELMVRSSTRVQPIRAMDEAYEARIDGKAYPFLRLEQAPIHY